MGDQSIHRRDVLRTLAVGGLATAGLVSADPSITEAREIEIGKVPPRIKEAASQVLKGAKWTTAHRTMSHFELEGKDSKNHDVSVEITIDGKITGVDRKIDVKDVPANIMKTVTNKFPKFTSDRVHEVYSGTDIRDLEKADLTYELDGTGAKGHEVTVTLSSDGKLIDVKREVELKAVPKVVTEAMEKKFPRFKPTLAHSVSEGEGVTGYLFVGEFQKNMRETLVFVSADGKEVEIHHDGE
jgi:hypothetical protein